MDIIVSHNKADFDALASMVAAQKLYPGAAMVFTGKPSGNVQEFMSLHKDSFDVKNPREIKAAAVKKLIIVDTKRRSRIGSFADILDNPHVEVIIYDHHPASPEDIKFGHGMCDNVGATVTLLVEELIKQQIAINPFESTVLALGIYEDTGSLTFSGTTARDAHALAWLLANKANLRVIANFIDRPLSEEQQELLNILISRSKVHIYNATRVLVASGATEEYVGGLDLLTHKIRDIFNQDCIFVVAEMGDRVHLVGRSSVEHVRVNTVLREFGGAGHDKAASATIKGLTMDEVLGKLHQILHEHIKPLVLARDIMSSPVKTVDMNKTLIEAGKIMLRYGHTGLPVVDGEKVVGIISRRDMEKAKHHGLGHAPVKGFMSWKVITVSPETPLPFIQQLMIENDIGRVPVVEQGKLVGIISRSDILGIIHGANIPHRFQLNFIQACALEKPENLTQRMQRILPPKMMDTMFKIGQLADKLNNRAYLVGGFVRDLLLGVPNLDFDIVVEGDGLAFANALANGLGARVRAHEKFATATLFLPDGLKFDVATARTEYYEYPAALPVVESGSLKQDLYRRDFTINAMAIHLNQDSFGELIDFFFGRSDLEQKIIRVLYNLSFIEDPTRIIRAIRFEKRYGFKMEIQTERFAIDAINNKLIEELSFHRIREELMLLLKEEDPLSAIDRMNQIKLWHHIFPEVHLTEEIRGLLKQIPTLIKSWHDSFLPFEKEILYLLVLFHHLNYQQIRELTDKFHWRRKVREEILKTSQRKEQVLEVIQSAIDPAPSTWHHLLNGLLDESIAYFMLISHDLGRHRIRRYLMQKNRTEVEINGHDLIKLGLAPGPEFKRLIQLVFEHRLDGKVGSKEEELALILNTLSLKRGD